MATSHKPDLPSPSTYLLSKRTESSSYSNPSQQKPTKNVLLISLILISCTALAAATSFAFLFFSSSSSSSSSSQSPQIETPHLQSVARSQINLDKPVVILISSDGFRFGYQFKTDTPYINRLITGGIEAEKGLIPVFPTQTFPNHYSIATGLYPASHGIVNNYFTDPAIPNEKFAKNSNDPKWWLGEPLWETVVKHGLKAATYFWPGSEVKRDHWKCPSDFCQHYDPKHKVPFEDRVDTILGYFDLPSKDIPDLIALYFEDPDSQGHQVGPDDPQITKAVANIEKMIAKLVKGLEKRKIFEDVTIILVGDHGMAGTCEEKLIILEDLEGIEITEEWVESYGAILSIRPPDHSESSSPQDVVDKMKKGLKKVKNGMNLKVYLKKDLPKRLHYTESSDRIAPIIGLVDEGFKVRVKRSGKNECGGLHGYDNKFFSMRTIFIGYGPQFPRGSKVKSFENVQIYNMVTSILKIKGASNNGSISFVEKILLK